VRLRIVAKHTELTEPLKEFAHEKIEKLEKYFDRISQAQLILSPDFVARRGSEDQGGGDTAAVDTDEMTEPGQRPESEEHASGHLAAVELLLTVAGERKPLVARARGESFQAAIDLVLDKMERQLTKSKEKRRERRQARGGR
jgi:ribosomal subunit interface protein